jgi:adenylyltransferase/sulfurtransferase
VQIAPHRRGRVALEALAERLAPFGEFRTEADSLRGEFASESGEFGRITLHVFSTGRAIVGGTTDPARARAIYTKFVGG